MAKTPPKLPGRAPARARTRLSPTQAFGSLPDQGRLRTVPIDAIQPNPRQPRRAFDPDALRLLADSIAERGVLQPPVVRALDAERFELVAGERRTRAARLAGLTELEVLVDDADDARSLLDAVLENAAREDFSSIESARAHQTIIDDLGLTREALGRRVGVNRATISNHLRLLDLPVDAVDLLDRGELTFAHGRALLLTDDHDTCRALARRAVKQGWSTRQLEQAARDAGAPRARRPAVDPDAAALSSRLGDALSAATGMPVGVRVARGGAVTIALTATDLQDARTLATRLGVDVDLLDL